jgi:hypothetical protein
MRREKWQENLKYLPIPLASIDFGSRRVIVIAAIIGAVVGVSSFLIKYVIDYFIHRMKSKKEVLFLCIRVSVMLEQFNRGCADVILDDGLVHGRPGKDGYSRPQVQTPGFDPESLEVEWKLLPAHLLDHVFISAGKDKSNKRYAVCSCRV